MSRALVKKMMRLGACEDGLEWLAKQKGTEADIYKRVEDPAIILWLVMGRVDSLLVVNAVMDVLERFIKLSGQSARLNRLFQDYITLVRKGGGPYSLDYQSEATSNECRSVLQEMNSYLHYSSNEWFTAGRLVCKGMTSRGICSILRKRLTYKVIKEAERKSRNG